MEESGNLRSKAALRWKNIIRQVLAVEEEEQDDERDAVGEHMTRLLNKHLAFSHQSQTGALQHGEDVPTINTEELLFNPLLSSKNLRRWYQSIRNFNFRPSRTTVSAMAGSIKEFLFYLFQDCQSISTGLRILPWTCLFAATLIALSAGVAIVSATHTALFVGTMIAAILVDVTELKSMCPKPVLVVLDALLSILKWIDASLLRGNNYTKREWNDDGYYVTDGEAAKSQRCTLLKCPPPPLGPESTNHATAIHFCHAMLQQDHQQQAKRKSMKRAAASLSSSGSIAKNGTNGGNGKERRVSSEKVQSDCSAETKHLSLLPPLGGEEKTLRRELSQDLEIVTSRSAGESFAGNCSVLGEGDGVPERSHHHRIMSDDASVIRRSLSDSDIFGVFSDDESVMSLSNHDRSPGKPRRLVQRQTSDEGDDMDWAEVGARIGMRILSSEHVQRAVASQDTKERFFDISKKVERKFGTPSGEASQKHRINLQSNMVKFGNDDTSSEADATFSDLMPPMKPVHSMWTSAASAIPSSRDSDMSSVSDVDDVSVAMPPAPSVKRFWSNIQNGDFPPRSPRTLVSKLSLRSSGSSGKSVSFHNRQWLFSEPESLTTIESRDEDNTPDLSILSMKDKVFANPYRIEDQNRSMEVVRVEDKEGTAEEHICPSEGPREQRLESPSGKEYPRRSLLKPGVKIVVPIFPICPGVKMASAKATGRSLQMATVISSNRIHTESISCSTNHEIRNTNCLSVTVSLDKSFLRDGGFAQMTVRIMDSWSDRFMPRHSKFPIGSCVATTFGVGVLIGWRVEDDCHLVRGLWQRKGSGSGDAYLNRNALHGTVEASIGFPVDTKLGKGVVISYVYAGREFRHGRYFVQILEVGRNKGHVLEFNRCDILACRGPAFVPVIELIREAAEFQLQVDNYEAAMRRQLYNNEEEDEKKWRSFSEGFETIWHAFLKAVEEDEAFDNGVNEFFSDVIAFLDQLENPSLRPEKNAEQSKSVDTSGKTLEKNRDSASMVDSPIKDKANTFAWFADDLFGGVFAPKTLKGKVMEQKEAIAKSQWNKMQYDKAYAVIRSLMRTVTIARADCKQKPNLKLTLSIVYEFLLFVRTVIKIQQKNVSAASLAVWERAIEEIVATFGPIKARLEKIGEGIAERVQKQGNKAKIRIIRFVDIIVSDEILLRSLERGEWDICLTHLEQALVQARIIDEASRENYHKTIQFVLSHFSPTAGGSAAARNNKKIVRFAKVLKWMASPRRSFLKLMRATSMLEILQRIFVRVFQNDPVASRMISIHASSMTDLRSLRMLKDFTISGKLWIPILEAADKELSFAVSKMPETSQGIMVPLSQLFSLGVAQFHVIAGGDLTADWMDFLMEEQAIRLIHEIDVELILSVESFSKDVKEVLTVLPYYASIDDDILNLMDEVNVDEFLREAADAINDADRLTEFIREKSTIAIQRFLDYLPKMSIPVEQRKLGDGWAISCRSETGGDLTLSDVNIKRENLTCQVMGGETIFFPMFAGDESLDIERGDVEIVLSEELKPSSTFQTTESILDHILELLLNAQRNGCWQPGIGGVGQQPSDRYVATVFKGLPVSTVLNTGLELWRSLEIDDDELMEIAIKDVSFQIQLQQEREKGMEGSEHLQEQWEPLPPVTATVQPERNPRRRFNPRVDPTLLYLEMKRLTVNLDKFRFRIAKVEKTLFDPVFEGWGTISIQNVSIKIRVECRKERLLKLGTELIVPVLHCRELEVQLEKVKFKVKDTGADWVLNKAVSQWGKDITDIVETNLKEQVRMQVAKALENLNAYFQINPDLMLNILGITMDDLEENLVYV